MSYELDRAKRLISEAIVTFSGDDDGLRHTVRAIRDASKRKLGREDGDELERWLTEAPGVFATGEGNNSGQ